MASEETTINSKQIDINDTIGIKLNANQAELYSTDGKIPIFAKCGDNEIKLIDENGNTYLKSLTVNGKNIENMSDELNKVLNIFKGAEWSKTFSVGRDKGDNETSLKDETYFHFTVPFKGAKYTVTCSEMTDSLTGNKDSPVLGKEKNGVYIYKRYEKLGPSYYKIHTFTENGYFGPITLDNDLLIVLDTQEEITGKNFGRFGSHYAQAGSCKITLKLNIED